MSTTNRKFVLFYILLVGLPILGLIGVLRKGRSVSAPISVDGSWTIQTNSLGALPCGNSPVGSPDQTLAISQSGETFTLSLAGAQKEPIFGVLKGTILKASGPSSAWPGENGCASGHDFSLLATVDPKANPRSLSGTVSLNGCASCTPVEFLAVRQVSAEKRGQ
jgi:hypothetical protein